MDMSNNSNYINLTKFSFKLTLIFFGIVFIFSLAQIASLYFVYIPKYINYFHDHLNDADLSLLNDAMNKIIIDISVLVFVLLILNIVLIKILHNAKKLALQQNQQPPKEKLKGTGQKRGQNTIDSNID